MKMTNNGQYHFKVDEKQIRFQEDMHDFAIMSDNENGKHILFPNDELAQQESDRLNALNIKDLKTRPLGIPWRIMLITWQDNSVLMECRKTQ